MFWGFRCKRWSYWSDNWNSWYKVTGGGRGNGNRVEQNISYLYTIYIIIFTYLEKPLIRHHHHHHHHHHVHEWLGVFPVPSSSKWSWSLHLFLGRPMFFRPFGLHCSACFGILFLSILSTCSSHFSWYCFISFAMFCVPVFFPNTRWFKYDRDWFFL